VFVVVWTGLGLLVFPLFGLGIVAAVVLDGVVGPVGTTVGLVIGTAVLAGVGRLMNRDGNEHTLYGIPVQHWAWIQGLFAALSVVLMLA